MRLPPIGRVTVVTSRAEQYRQLARDCRSLARSLPPGESRVAMQEMAQQWDRLADQPEHATDLRQKSFNERWFCSPGSDRRDGCPAAYASRHLMLGSHAEMSRPRKTSRERMSEWVLHCAVNQRHIRRSQPTRDAALKDACVQLLQGHAVNRIVGPNETINAERVRDWCAKHRPSPKAPS